MRFDREPWVKLYKHEGPQHRLMSLEARSFRDFLLRFAKSEDGVLLEKSKQPFRDLCRVIAADSKDARKVKKWSLELIDVGYLILDESGKLTIKRFVEAQSARSKNAERQARWKEKQRQQKEQGETLPEGVTGNGDSNAKGDAGETLHARSRDEMRRDEIPPVGPPSGTTAEVPDPDEDQPTPCPTEVLPDDVVQQLSAHLGVSVDVIRDAEREFKTFWTIGKGAGKRFRRGMWIRKCRERIRHRYEAGELRMSKATQASGSVLTP